MTFNSFRDKKGDIPQYQPQRTTPIYEYITRRFLCEENVVGDISELTQLSWNIHTPQETYVWKSCKLHIPLKISAKSGGKQISMRVADRLPACNVALSAAPMRIFTDCQLTVNGRMFSSQPNNYEAVLNTCYQSRDENSYQSNNSLKPIACRNLHKNQDNHQTFLISDSLQNDVSAVDRLSVEITSIPKINQHAFDLNFANPGFARRSQEWQTNLQGSNTFCETNLISYLDIGPFCNKVRKTVSGERQYNTAVPYIKDFSLRLMVDRRESEFDISSQNSYAGWPGRVLASGLLEFGTLSNLHHAGDTELPVDMWAQEFEFEITSKPFLEVEYVDMGSQLQDAYKLRYIDYQHEQSSPFSFDYPNGIADDQRWVVAQPVPVRLDSRLLEVCSKVYLWADLAQSYRKPFFRGGCDRFCTIKDLHLRINNRNDLLFEPTQEFCFQQFKKLTSNRWTQGTWSKSPVYVFDPSTFGLDEYLTGQAQLMNYEWICNVEPTTMECQEMEALNKTSNMVGMGYHKTLNFNNFFTVEAAHSANALPLWYMTINRYFNYFPNPGYEHTHGQADQAWRSARQVLLTNAWEKSTGQTQSMWLEVRIANDYYDHGTWERSGWKVYNSLGQSVTSIWDRMLTGLLIRQPQVAADEPQPDNVTEIMKIESVTASYTRLDGLIWWVVDTNTDRIVITGETRFWYVPESWPFSLTRDQRVYEANGAWHAKQYLNDPGMSYRPDTNTWAAPSMPYFEGSVVMQDMSGTGVAGSGQIQTKLFNSGADGVDRFVTPGPRGYPYRDYQSNILGMMCQGLADGSGAAAGRENRSGVNTFPRVNQSSTRAAPHGGATAAANGGTWKWCCGRLRSADLVAGADTHPVDGNGVNGRLFGDVIVYNSNGADVQNVVNGAGLACGDVKRPFHPNPAANNHKLWNTGYETYLLRCTVERNLYNTQTNPGVSDYTQPPPAGDNAYGDVGKMGCAYHSLSSIAGDQGIHGRNPANDLQYQLNVLYEFGEKNYIVERDGKMLPGDEYPDIKIRNNVVSGKSTYGKPDPRSESQGGRMGRIIGENEFNRQ